jgi:hypothetical protein
MKIYCEGTDTHVPINQVAMAGDFAPLLKIHKNSKTNATTWKTIVKLVKIQNLRKIGVMSRTLWIFEIRNLYKKTVWLQQHTNMHFLKHLTVRPGSADSLQNISWSNVLVIKFFRINWNLVHQENLVRKGALIIS